MPGLSLQVGIYPLKKKKKKKLINQGCDLVWNGYLLEREWSTLIVLQLFSVSTLIKDFKVSITCLNTLRTYQHTRWRIGQVRRKTNLFLNLLSSASLNMKCDVCNNNKYYRMQTHAYLLVRLIAYMRQATKTEKKQQKKMFYYLYSYFFFILSFASPLSVYCN